MTRSDLDALKEKYPVSDDVLRLNTTGKESQMFHKGNPATAIINNPQKLRNLRKVVGIQEAERDFASWFEDFLHLKGYKFAHFRPARVMRNGKETYETPVSGDATGLEDYFIWHEDKRVYLWAELKSETGKLSEKQKAIIDSH